MKKQSLEDIITIELFGQSYSVRAENDVTTARKVADLLVQEVENVEKQLSNQPSDMNKIKILVLAALNIANENVELKRNQTDLLKNISERAANLINKMADSNLHNPNFIV